jgi:hypothetical protein
MNLPFTVLRAGFEPARTIVHQNLNATRQLFSCCFVLQRRHQKAPEGAVNGRILP